MIARVITDNPGVAEKELRKLLREAYPFGPMQFHPYKIWLDEINVQLGKKKDTSRPLKTSNGPIDTPLFD